MRETDNGESGAQGEEESQSSESDGAEVGHADRLHCTQELLSEQDYTKPWCSWWKVLWNTVLSIPTVPFFTQNVW